nr:uncharacterized protein LOC124495226 [Dermatophagoides farinae]
MNFSGICHDELKFIVEKNGDRQYRRKCRLDSCVFYIIITRLVSCIISYAIDSTPSDSRLWQMDPYSLNIYVDHKHLYINFMILILMLVLIAFRAHVSLYNQPNVLSVSFQLPYDLIVINRQQYNQCLLSEEKLRDKIDAKLADFHENIDRNNFKRWFYRHLIIFKLWFKLENVDHRRLASFAKFNTLATMSMNCRQKLIITQTILEKCFRFIKIAYGPLTLQISFHSYENLYQPFKIYLWNRLLLFIGEMFLIIYFVWLLLRFIIFISTLQLLIFTYVICTIAEMKHQLRNIATNFSMKIDYLFIPTIRGRCLPIKMIQQLCVIHCEHLRLSIYFCKSFQEVWGPFFFIFITFSIPIHVMSLVSLRSLSNNSELRLQVYIVFIIHSLILTIGLGILAIQTSLLHSVDKYLPAIIPVIKHTGLKLRYENWFERLMNGKKYGPSFEPIGTITGQTLLNLLFIYVGMLFFILKHIETFMNK